MARASTSTQLTLDRWAQILGISPIHFNQVYVDPITLCGQPWFQYAWQAQDRISREDVATAIAQAEADIERVLGHRLIPTWEVDEWVPTVPPFRPELFNLTSHDLRGFDQSAFMTQKHFISGGIRSQELIEADAAVVYSDEDGDGYDETATITVAVTTSNVCEIAIYFSVPALVAEAGDERWRIRPANVSIAAGTATITVRREQLVDPVNWEKVAGDQDALDGNVNGNFVTSVDVYRVYHDPQQQVTLLWEPFGTACGNCTGTGCAACAYTVQTGCLLVRGNPKNSIIVYHPATWDSDNLEFTTDALSVARQPDLLRVWYYAGLRDKRLSCPTLEMSQEWAYTVAVYSVSLLERPICNCDNAREFVARWQIDLAKQTPEASYKIDPRDLGNPFGTKAGAVYAWNRVKEASVGEAIFA